MVGRTGAGKSSLVLALLRVLRASEGRILIDDIDIASVPLRKLRNAVTVIPQVQLNLSRLEMLRVFQRYILLRSVFSGEVMGSFTPWPG